MFRRCIPLAVIMLGALAIVVAGVAQQAPTEAPTGFDTPTLAQNNGSQSVSNGITEPAGDNYALDQTRFEQIMMPALGWGRYLTPEPARIVTRTLLPAGPVNSQKSAPAITTPTAISLTRPFQLTTVRPRSRIAPLLMTAR